MMDCETARDLMLEADPAELRADGDTDLVMHLRDCVTCSAAAARLLAGLAALDRGLDALAAQPVAARRRNLAAHWLPAAALAAAAVAALIVIPDRAPPPLDADALYAALNPEPPIVDAAGRPAVVMRDEARNITIVWLTQSSTEKQP